MKSTHKRGIQGAFAAAKSRRKRSTTFYVTAILDSTVLELPTVPQTHGLPSIKLLPRKEGESEAHSFLLCPNSLSEGIHSFSNLWLSKAFGSSYYGNLLFPSRVIMVQVPDPWPHEAFWQFWKNKAMGALRSFIGLFVTSIIYNWLLEPFTLWKHLLLSGSPCCLGCGLVISWSGQTPSCRSPTSFTAL